ncbi:hypothetical protein N431DRAFT_99382 [Stipitochalara longipes BDJ]|nr:hypothetical protein N431DRAFT_99382 [Stipitochalara longipes BDJ]
MFLRFAGGMQLQRTPSLISDGQQPCGCRPPTASCQLPTAKCRLLWQEYSEKELLTRLQAGHDARRSWSAVTMGVWFLFRLSSTRLHSSHLTSCTGGAEHECVCLENRGHTIGERVSGERIIALCPNGLLYAEIYDVGRVFSTVHQSAARPFSKCVRLACGTRSTWQISQCLPNVPMGK